MGGVAALQVVGFTADHDAHHTSKGPCVIGKESLGCELVDPVDLTAPVLLEDSRQYFGNGAGPCL